MPDKRPSSTEVLSVLNGSVSRAQEKSTFEIALVLGGTVSAGAYTAGFLDMLVEALDCWYLAKERGEAVPGHDVVIRVVSGASGGGVCAAMLARALAYKFPHVSPTTGPGDAAANPFYRTWVETLDSSGFLDTSDVRDGEPLVSLFNGELISRATQAAADFVGSDLPAGWTARPYVDNPLRVIVTLANLTGVPYAVDLGPAGVQSYVTHADHARFACDVSAAQTTPSDSVRPDEFFVQRDGSTPAVNWLTIAKYARASAAFPLGFPPVVLQRPRSHYDYRAVAVPDDKSGKVKQVVLQPCWPPDHTGDEYAFLSVDGGTFNNEPLQLARTYLAGVGGHNPRDSKKANRAVVLVDPLPTGASLGTARFESLVKLGGSLLGALVNQGRYSTADLVLMADQDVFSRFIVVPQRGEVVGEKALATAGLGAFLGFFEKEYRRHDYLLGRANCRAFLREKFALHRDNPLFAGASGPLREAPDGYVPIVPLVGAAALDDAPVPWPQGRLTARQLCNRLKGRLERIIEKVADDAIDFPLSDFPIQLLKGAAAGKLLEPIARQIEADLRDWKL